MVLVRGGIKVKPHVQRCADAVVKEFGPGLSPGTYNGHSPPEGPTQALDLFTPTNAEGYALQKRICDWLIRNQRRFNVRYCIRWNPDGNDLIWNIERAAEGWRAKATRDHRDHVHVTFYADDPGETTQPNPPPIPTPSEVMSMELNITYKYEKEDWILLSGILYFGKLPFGETLDALKDEKIVHDLGERSKGFHDGIMVLANTAGLYGVGR